MDWFLIASSSWGEWWLVPGNWLAMFKVAAGLGFVILVHEFGHFAVAKMCGVKCEKFYIGFDFFELKIGKWVIIPRALFKFKYGETEYGLGIIPLGGYVKMLGQDDNPANREEENERSRVKDGDASPAAPIKHDPRSYLAKSVPQRMAIISAGVIMNLIFAVIFASVAYMFGVPYMPCVVGDTVPGGAAWRAGLRPGSKVIQINDAGIPTEHLRWDWDLKNATGMAGLKGEVELLVRTPENTEETVRLRPRGIPVGKTLIPTLGVIGANFAILDGDKPPAADTPAGQTEIPFVPNDRIVAVRAKSQATAIPVGEKEYDKIEAVLAQYPGESITFSVERTDKKAKSSTPPEELSIEVAPAFSRTLGLHMRRGPITGVRPGSPAEKAGLKEGDVIHRFAGQKFGDPMTFAERLAPHHGKQIALDIERPDEAGKLQPLTVQITPETPRRYSQAMPGADYSVESLGIVYPVFQFVHKIDPQGPAAKSGLKPGDQIVQIQIVPKPSQHEEEQERWNSDIRKPHKVDPLYASWPHIHDTFVQGVMPETQLKLYYRRTDNGDLPSGPASSKDELHEALLSPAVSEFHRPERGLHFAGASEIRTAKSFPEAVGLGLRQTKEDALKIVLVLRKLVSGEVSPFNLSGGGMIFVIATSEAAQSTSRLLIFLTFLSANLAVVNFLPIPVLDGGHMMFLTWEGIFRRPLPEKWQFSLTLGGLAFVLCLFLFTTSLDVFRLLIDPFLQ